MAQKAIVRRVENDWYLDLLEDLRQLEYTGIVVTKHAIGQRILADELKFGKPEYGSKKIEGLAKELGYGKSDLYNCVRFAREYSKIPTALENSSWRHISNNILPEHREEPETPPLPEGTFNVIYADPPWCYGDKRTGFGGAEDHYPSMTIEELCAMDVPVADNAVLFLWVTSPILAECWPIVTAWGFQYKASFVWDKMRHVLGHYNSVRHEFLLICTRGSFLPQDKTLHDSVVSIERTKHSEKPDYFRELIEKMYPNGKKLELFGRKKVIGWTVYGNDPAIR